MTTTHSTADLRPAALTPARSWAAVVVLSVSLLMIGLDNTILNVTLPTLQRELSATSAQLQWIVDAYLLAFAGLLLSAGNLGDRWGRRRVLQAGLVVFGGGSALAALSDSAAHLIASRALMGVGAAMIMPSTLSIIANMFTGPRRATAIAIWTAVAGIGIALGPVLGGWLLERFWWGSIFLVNVPIAVLSITAGAALVPESRDPDAGRADPVGLVLSVAGLLTLVYGVIEAPTRGWTDPVTLTAFAVATAVLAAFGWWELRSPHPMLQIRLLRNPRFGVASAVIALAFFALFGALFFLTQYLQLVLGYSALGAGARTVPVAGGLILGAAISTPLTARIGTKVTVTAGMLLAAAGVGILTSVTPDSGYPPVLLALILAGTGIGVAMAPATDSVMGSLPLAKASVGSATNDTARLVGGAFGVAVLGTVISQVYSDRMTDATALLSGPAADAARDSLYAATQVADRLDGTTGSALMAAARAAFTDAVNIAAAVGAAVIVVAAVVALALLPNRPVNEPSAGGQAADG